MFALGFLGNRWRERLRRCWLGLVLVVVASAVLGLYAPTLSIGFVNDDFIEVGARHFDALDTLQTADLGLWAERFVHWALIDPVTDWQIFRPTRQVMFWSDYLMWGLEPIGYRVTNLVLYICASWVVVLLEWRLTRRRLAAGLAGLLFAVHTVHAAPISSISSRGHLLAALFVGLCLLFYVLPRTRRNTIVSVAACALAIGSKETALVTPALLLLYELVFHRHEMRRAPGALVLRQLPYWLTVAAALGARWLAFGGLATAPQSVGGVSWAYQVEGYILYAVRPFLLDIGDAQAIVILVCLAALGVLYRSRPEVVFGLLMVPLALVVTASFPPFERYFITPSIGLALAFGSVLAEPLLGGWHWKWQLQAAGLATAGLLLIGFGAGTLNRNGDYRALGLLTERFLSELKTLEPTLQRKARLVFVGVPTPVRGGTLFISARHLEYAAQLIYGDRSLRVATAENFPATAQALDRTYFFEYGDRELTERRDLVQQLRDRKSCADATNKRIVWDFRKDAQGWSPWSEMEQFESNADGLNIRVTGKDPFMGGPFIEVNPGELERVEVTMRAQAATPTLSGELYWQTAGMSDFAGDARVTFQIQADDARHIYALKLPPGGQDPIVRLRFDPADAPSEIVLEQIALVCK